MVVAVPERCPQLPALVEPPAPATAKLTRHGEGAVLWTGARGGRGVLVAGIAPPDVVELWDWVLEPGEQHFSEAHSPGTRELLQVLGGRMRVQAVGRTYELGEGDALTFHGDAEHSYANPGDVPVRFNSLRSSRR